MKIFFNMKILFDMKVQKYLERKPVTVFDIFSEISSFKEVQNCTKNDSHIVETLAKKQLNFYDVTRFACQQANYEINYHSLATCNNEMKLSRYRMSQKSFRLLNLNIFRSTKFTKVNEVFSETL